MDSTWGLHWIQTKIRSAVFDMAALTFIYFVPAISHLLSFPLYLLEPMRIMVVFSIAHTSKRNTYLIALTLPLFSLLVSAHPLFYKTILIAFELTLNVYVFYAFDRRLNSKFVVMMLSVLISKMFYYGVKLLLINLSLLETGLISSPLHLQLVVVTVLSAYIHFLRGGKRL
jgi:hypothetical protein